MSEIPRESQRPVVRLRPQPDIYTVLLVIAIVAMAATLGIVLWNLLSPPPDGYGLPFSALFDPSKLPPTAQ